MDPQPHLCLSVSGPCHRTALLMEKVRFKVIHAPFKSISCPAIRSWPTHNIHASLPPSATTNPHRFRELDRLLATYHLTYLHNLCLTNCHCVCIQLYTPPRIDTVQTQGGSWGRDQLKPKGCLEATLTTSYLHLSFSRPNRYEATLPLVQAFCCSLVLASRVLLGPLILRLLLVCDSLQTQVFLRHVPSQVHKLVPACPLHPQELLAPLVALCMPAAWPGRVICRAHSSFSLLRTLSWTAQA